MKAILTVGIPGSGKTTWAEQQEGYVNINRDDIRMELFQLENYNEYKFTKKREKEVTARANSIINECSENDLDIIISDTNLNEGRRIAMVQYLEGLGYDVQIEEFPINFWEAVNRDQNRNEKTVGRTVIYRMYKNWLKYKGRKKYDGTPDMENAYIFDIDGTIASMDDKDGNRIRGPFEWDKVDLDEPIPHVIAILELLKGHNDIILLSGRDGSCRDKTIQWLNTHLIHWDYLFMREAGDLRQDATIKEEIFWQYIAPNHNVKAIFDDRSQVCLMWHELGIPLFKCGDPILEF